MAWCSCQYCRYLNGSNRYCNYYGAYADDDLGKSVFSYDECAAYSEKSSSYDDDDSSSGSSGCFMTSACCDYYHLPDNCAELETMRSFRDNVLVKNEDGIKLRNEYYLKAPGIVKFIERNPLRDYYYEDIYQSILKCKKYIEENDNENAIDTYNQMFRKYLRLSGKKMSK